MKHFLLIQGKFKKWGRGGRAGRKKEKEKGKTDGKFCLKWKLLT